MENGVKGGAQVLTVIVMILAGLAALSSLGGMGSRIYTLQSGKLPGQGILETVVKPSKGSSRASEHINAQWSAQVEQQKRFAPAVFATTLPYALVTAAVCIMSALLLARRATRRQLMWLSLAACLLRLPVAAVTALETLNNVEISTAAIDARMAEDNATQGSEKAREITQTVRSMTGAMLIGSVVLVVAFGLGVAAVFGAMAWVMSRRAPAVAAEPLPPTPLMN